MKKIVPIIILILVILILTIISIFFYFRDKKLIIPNNDNLVEKCQQLAESNPLTVRDSILECCLKSVDIIVENNYYLAPSTELDSCPNDYQGDALLCKGSFTWCKPIENSIYDLLADECQNDSCCLESVERMSLTNFQLAPGDTLADSGCPDGTAPNAIKCPTSYLWCEPMNDRNDCLSSQISCQSSPCGPMPDGRNSCLTGGGPNICYYPCETDNDCPQNMLCVEDVECISGDAIALEKVCQ